MREERKCCIWVKSLIFKITYFISWHIRVCVRGRGQFAHSPFCLQNNHIPIERGASS